jgi:gag-polypeptide of LTR copia-type
MAELKPLQYKSGDMSDYVDRYAALLDRLESMDSKVPPELAIILFIHSMNGKYEATIAALRTLGDEKLNWEYVNTRLIEEDDTNSYKGGTSTSNNNATVLATLKSVSTTVCSQGDRPGHEKANYLWNPDNPKNKLESLEIARFFGLSSDFFPYDYQLGHTFPAYIPRIPH